MDRTPCEPIELYGLDTDRKNSDTDRPVHTLKCVWITARHSTFLLQIACEICGVDFALKTDKIVVTHRRNEVFMIWKCRQNFGWWKRNMVKKSNPVAMTAIP